MRRGRVEIWADILLAVRRTAQRKPVAAPSRIQASVNLPHDRFWKHVTDLETHGLLRSEPLQTTREGERFLARTQALREELDRLLRPE